MIAFGRLILALCSRAITVNNYAKALEYVARSYSADLKNAIVFLMSPPSPHKVCSYSLHRRQAFDTFVLDHRPAV
jgi:hypothetical protein